MSREHHFRGESFGAAESVESVKDEYLQALVEHYKDCFLMEKSGKSPEELVMVVRSIEREIEMMDSWNGKMEEMLEMKDLEVERLQEDIRNADEELAGVDRVRRELEERVEQLYLQKAVKDSIIQKQDFLISGLSGKSERVLTPKKLASKTSRNRYESPSLV